MSYLGGRSGVRRPKAETVATETSWYQDLASGAGDAAKLDDDLRQALRIGTESLAREQALRSRVEQAELRRRIRREQGAFASATRATRIRAALYSGLAVMFGHFSAWVLTRIWGASYPDQAATIASSIAHDAAPILILAALVGLLVLRLGWRAPFVPALGLLLAVSAGIFRDQAALIWLPIFSPLADVLLPVIAFWGWSTALIAMVGAGVAIGLVVRSTIRLIDVRATRRYGALG